MTELKPCPFCGGEARLCHPKGYGITLGSVKCNSCGGSTESFTDDDSAIEAWNTRPTPWHTGTPTEEGWYLVAFTYNHDEGVRYTTDYLMSDGKWAFPIVNDLAKVEAWMPIPPFEEKEDGHTD